MTDHEALVRVLRRIHNRALGWGWDNADSILPRLYVLIRRSDGPGYVDRYLSISRSTWHSFDSQPVRLLDSLRGAVVAGSIEGFVGMAFTMEGWAVKDADRYDDVMATAARRQLYRHPDRFTVRDTYASPVQGVAVALTTYESAPDEVTYFDEDSNVQSFQAGVPRTLRRLVDRILANSPTEGGS